MRYTIFGNQDYNTILISKLDSIGYILDEENPQVIFSIGGDGTMLGAVRKYMARIDEVMFLGINTGRLGFYTDFLPEEIDDLIEVLSKDEIHHCKFNLLEYNLIGLNENRKSYALNELAITNPIHTQIIDVYINEIHFETFRGTGFLISTPSGSTAYNKSLGGSVIHPEVKSFQLTEIASINNRVYKTISSPLVFGKKQKIKLVSENYNNIFIISDGVQECFDDIHTIEATLSEKTVTLLTKEANDFWIRVRKAFIE